MLKNKTAQDIGIIIIFGALTGLFTSFGQTYIPEPFGQLANSYSVWLLMSFAAALLVHRYRYAIIGGALIQYLAIAFYYIATITRFDSGFSLTSNIIWLVGGTIVGPIVGFLGHYLRSKQKYDYLAPAFVAGLLISESMYQFFNLKYYSEGWVFAVLGLSVGSLLIVLYKTNITKTIATTAVFTACMYFCYAVVLGGLFN